MRCERPVLHTARVPVEPLLLRRVGPRVRRCQQLLRLQLEEREALDACHVAQHEALVRPLEEEGGARAHRRTLRHEGRQLRGELLLLHERRVRLVQATLARLGEHLLLLARLQLGTAALALVDALLFVAEGLEQRLAAVGVDEGEHLSLYPLLLLLPRHRLLLFFLHFLLLHIFLLHLFLLRNHFFRNHLHLCFLLLPLLFPRILAKKNLLLLLLQLFRRLLLANLFTQLVLLLHLLQSLHLLLLLKSRMLPTRVGLNTATPRLVDLCMKRSNKQYLLLRKGLQTPRTNRSLVYLRISTSREFNVIKSLETLVNLRRLVTLKQFLEGVANGYDSRPPDTSIPGRSTTFSATNGLEDGAL